MQCVNLLFTCMYSLRSPDLPCDLEGASHYLHARRLGFDQSSLWDTHWTNRPPSLRAENSSMETHIGPTPHRVENNSMETHIGPTPLRV